MKASEQRLYDEFGRWLVTMAPWLRNFSGAEVLTKCDRPLNCVPPKELWPHILPTLRIVQDLRVAVGHPLTVNSVYRSPAYNATLPGSATHSQHTEFRAMDISCASISPRALYELMLSARNHGKFKGGLGLYATFVHVDTRGWNANWKGKGVR